MKETHQKSNITHKGIF